MKTLEEAFDEVITHRPDETFNETLERQQAFKRDLIAIAHRVIPMSEQAAQAIFATLFTEGIRDFTLIGSECFLNGLAIGVSIGVLMEKSE